MQREKRRSDAAQRAESNKAKRATGAAHASAAMDEEYPDYDDEAPLLG